MKTIKEQKIKEMAQVVCDNCSYKKINDCEIDSPCTDTLDICETLYNAGYRKTVWHKVTDGDLPKVAMHTIIYYKSELGFTDYRTDLFWNGSFVNFGEQVIAWTELPRYEGEE